MKGLSLAQSLKMLMESRIVHGKPLSANALAKGSGVAQSMITRMLSGETKSPRKEAIDKLAHYFGVTPAQLRGEDQGGNVTQVAVAECTLMYITVEEGTLLTAYRSSNEVGRAAIMAVVSALASQHAAAADRSNVRRIR